ncbi:MAG: chemotaxis protein CheX [Kiritimatiellae bacterium]|nr:chemotaxis protein CheX [Kiritimatiellia bacterium]
MPAKSLGQFLLERGVITQEQLLDALEYQRERIKPVCDTAVRSGQSTREELAELDRKKKATKSGTKKEEQEEDIRHRISSLQQLEASWRTLSERGVFLVEALSRKGYLSLEELDRLCKEYRQETTPPEIDLGNILPHAPETRKILESLIEIALDLFMHYVKQVPEIRSISRAFGDIEEDSSVFAQDISGEINVRYVLLLPNRLALAMASHILGEEVKTVGQLALDAVTEFLNVVVGNTCTKFSMRNYTVNAAAPQVVPLSEFRKNLPPHPIVVRAAVPDGDFYLAYLLQD